MNAGLSKTPRARTGPSDTLFRAAADQAPHVIWIVNSKGAVTYLNRAWYELVGGMPPEWHGHDWMKVVHADDVQAMRDNWKTVGATGAAFEGTRRVRARDGQWHTLAFKATPVFDDNGLLCWVGMDSDITELMQAQAALQLANQELEAFSYTVAHDLRAPLMTVDGFTKVLAKELDPVLVPRTRQFFTRVGAAVKHMNALMEGLLALSQVARGKLRFETVDLSALATEVFDELRARDPAREVDVIVEPGLQVYADERLASALLLNLVGNAWKFTAGTPNARISVNRVSKNAEEIVFSVADNGPGFDMEAAKELFSPFERLHGDEFAGTGIGLATVQRIVKRHGGRVWAEAAAREGATFFVALPVPRPI